MDGRRTIIWITLTVFLACLLQLYLLSHIQFDFFVNHNSSIGFTFEKPLWTFAPLFILGTAKKYSSNKFRCWKRYSIKSSTKSRGRVGIFTGIEAKMNHAIFEILDANGPLSTCEILKWLNKCGLYTPYYSSLNKRLHALERGSFIGQVSTGSEGSRATLYQLRPKFYLARFLNTKSHDEILSKLTDSDAEIILADLLNPE